MISILFALLQSTTAAATPAAPPPPWTAMSRTDAASGISSTSAFAFTSDHSARLVVRCDRVAEPVVSIQMRTKAGFAAGDDHIVSVSVDGGTPIDSTWEFPGTATMNREPSTITQLTVAMNSAKSITVTTTDGTASVSQIFPGPGASAGIKDVLSACGYEFGVVPQPAKPAAK